jgi:peroxiredoxin (alkyl hydroperoxide reductase subunit C)
MAHNIEMQKGHTRIIGNNFPKWIRQDQHPAAVPGKDEPEMASFLTPGKWKIVYFYPKDFTFVCPTEIVDFDNLVPEFEKLNAVVFGVSPDNEYVKLAWKKSNPLLTNLKHTLIADANNELAFDMGIIDEDGVPFRATYIVDPDETIQHVSMNNGSVGRNAAEILRILDACQQGGKGMLCPAARQVGGETISK